MFKLENPPKMRHSSQNPPFLFTFQHNIIHPSFKSEPNMYWAAALPATRPKTTQSKSELPPKRLLPCTPPATCQGENLWSFLPGIFGGVHKLLGDVASFFLGGVESKRCKKSSFSKRGHPGCVYLAKLYAWYKWAMKENAAKNSAASVAYKRTHVILPFAYWEGWQFNPNLIISINCNSLLQLSFWIFAFKFRVVDLALNHSQTLETNI